MRLPIAFVLLTTMVDAIGIGLIIPVMPALLREIGDVPLSEAALWGGLLATTYAVMQFLFGPLIGALSDRFGRRPVMLVSLGVLALDYLVMAIAQTFWLLFIGRIIGGIAAATQATALAFIADISKPSEKAARFGMVGAAFGVGFVLGPLLGGALAEFGTRAPFYTAALLAALTTLFGVFVMPETNARPRPFDITRANPLGAFLTLTGNAQLRRLVLVFFLYQVAFFVYPSIWAYFAEARFGWSPGMIGLSLGGFGISMAIVQAGLIRVILRQVGERGTVLYGITFNFFAFLAMASVTNGALALALTPLTALGAVVVPALQGLMSGLTEDDAQGELQGILSSTMALAMIGSPLIMTQIFAAFADPASAPYLPGAPFLISASLMVVCGLIFARSSAVARA